MQRLMLIAALAAATSAALANEPPGAAVPADTALCEGTPRQIEPDMRIEESHLDRTSALEATDRLRARIAAGELHGDLAFGVLNAVKVIDGHVRREQALAARREAGPDAAETRAATEAFCTWLADEGFWYD